MRNLGGYLQRFFASPASHSRLAVALASLLVADAADGTAHIAVAICNTQKIHSIMHSFEEKSKKRKCRFDEDKEYSPVHPNKLSSCRL